ncbi:hypothetical protein [Komagataeibacter kakiaceti]|uniref:hypothetical protein n=1 Tax=Komagataeibacter kakiaceti TaxID=943261 RepID=UPI000B2043D3|nr:hypothetical protein [Komagataeibacter kakiaceti]
MTTINPTSPQAVYLSLMEAGNNRDVSTASGTTPSASGISDDIVTLSAEAMTELAQAADNATDPRIADYTRFFPTSADTDATALGWGLSIRRPCPSRQVSRHRKSPWRRGPAWMSPMPP